LVVLGREQAVYAAGDVAADGIGDVWYRAAWLLLDYPITDMTVRSGTPKRSFEN